MTIVTYTRTAYDVDTIEYDGTQASVDEIIAMVGRGNVSRRQSEAPGAIRIYVYGEAIDVGDLVAKNTEGGPPTIKITPHKRDTDYEISE